MYYRKNGKIVRSKEKYMKKTGGVNNTRLPPQLVENYSSSNKQKNYLWLYILLGVLALIVAIVLIVCIVKGKKRPRAGFRFY